MMSLDPLAAARKAVAPSQDRAATAVLIDSPEMRIVVFRLAPGQQIAPHQTPAAVTITVLDGSGILSSEREERVCAKGEMVAYAPNELHGMRATAQEFLLLACITPRPGSRPVTPMRAVAVGA